MSEIARHPTRVMKPERSALVSQTINYLRDQISEGRWPTGTKLPVESELLQELRISRVILRQAMQALVHVGMVETIQGSGTFVRATNELDAVLIRYLAGENELAILEVRQALEITAAGLAAERATPGHIETMVRAVESAELAVAEGDICSAAEASTQFHVAVVAAAGNPVLAHFYGAIEQATTKTMVETSSERPAECFQREHREIIEAVAAADPDRARNLAGDHLDPVLIAARSQQTPST